MNNIIIAIVFVSFYIGITIWVAWVLTDKLLVVLFVIVQTLMLFVLSHPDKPDKDKTDKGLH